MSWRSGLWVKTFIPLWPLWGEIFQAHPLGPWCFPTWFGINIYMYIYPDILGFKAEKEKNKNNNNKFNQLTPKRQDSSETIGIHRVRWINTKPHSGFGQTRNHYLSDFESSYIPFHYIYIYIYIS